MIYISKQFPGTDRREEYEAFKHDNIVRCELLKLPYNRQTGRDEIDEDYTHLLIPPGNFPSLEELLHQENGSR